MKFNYFALLAATAAALTACGGAGGDAPAATTTATTVTTASAYAGNWTGQCELDNTVKIVTSATGVTPITTQPSYEIGAVKNVMAGASNSISAKVELQYFDNATCSGVAKGKQTRDLSFTIDGTTLIAGKTVDKVTLILKPIGGLSVGTTITINGLVYPGDYFTSGGTPAKDIFLVEGTKWFFGAESPADQYPTALDTVDFLTKQ